MRVLVLQPPVFRSSNKKQVQRAVGYAPACSSWRAGGITARARTHCCALRAAGGCWGAVSESEQAARREERDGDSVQ